MQRTIIFTWLMLVAAFTVSAAGNGVFMEYHRKSNPSRNTQVHRAPMHIPIEVTYDSNTKTIKIVGEESIEAEVYIYDIAGNIEDYSPSLGVTFQLTAPGVHIISIHGEGWYGEGSIQI